MPGESNEIGKQRTRTALEKEDVYGENVYEEVWLPLGDEKENDIMNLIQQKRIR
ncbi:MAG: hypothetical protein ABFD08_01695 [Syntrophomonas sp.]